MPVKTEPVFFKKFENGISVKLEEHSNWPPSGSGGITRYTDVSIEGPISLSRRLKFRDGNHASLDNYDNCITSVSEIEFRDGKYIAQTNRGKKTF